MQTIKTKLLNYLKSILVIVCLVALLAHGPHGGWVVGLAAALFTGFTFTSIIWLLDFKSYFNIFFALLIASITLLISIISFKNISLDSELFEELITGLITLSVFIFLNEIINFIRSIILRNHLQNNIKPTN